MRWEHHDLGLIMPDEFIGVAEDSGLISALGSWVVEQSCLALNTLHEKGHALHCAVNCSSSQLLERQFAEKVLDTLKQNGIDPHRIEFEITESAAIDDIEATLSAINQLRQEGAKVVLDDFGTGYSSLNYLRQLPVEIVKIDKSFIQDLLDNPSSQKIVKAVIDLAHALGLTVHAEGIEKPEQKEQLKAMGCDRLQGFLLGRPMPLQELLQWLDAQP